MMSLAWRRTQVSYSRSQSRHQPRGPSSPSLLQRVHDMGKGGTQTQAFATAAVDSTTNGFTHNGSNIWITIQQPTTAPYNTNRFVEVTITLAP